MHGLVTSIILESECIEYKYDEVCQWLATCRWLSPGPPVSSTNKKADRHDIAEMLLKMALNTIKTNKQTKRKQAVFA